MSGADRAAKLLPALAALLFSLSVAPPAQAVETQVRRYATAIEFAPGEMDHVSVTPEGKLVLSPDYRRLAELDEPVAWATVVAPTGEVYVATGHEGKVLRVAPDGPAVVFDSEELEVHALAVGRDGTLFAGTSPDGKVYRLARGKEPQVLFDPEERYIWALVVAGDGSVYIATGDKGAVYRVRPDGTSTPVLTAEETHVLSLVVAADGTLYAGSGGNGYVYRSTPQGEVSILLDAAGSEVKALALDASGNLYAASTGRSSAVGEIPGGLDTIGVGAAVTVFDETGGTPGSEEMAGAGSFPQTAPAGQGTPQTAPVQQPQPQPTPAVVVGVMQPAVLPGAYPPSGPRPSWLYRIRPDGLPEELWRSASETVHALALYRDQVALGTGNEGKVLSVEPASGRASILLDFPGAQVTALTAHKGGLLGVTSNLAAVWQVEAKPAPEGSYISPVIDAGHFATWGRLTLRASGTVSAQTRSGNTEKPGTRWSEWQEASGRMQSPKARYVQFRLRLTAAADKPTPSVHEVELAFLPYNLSPRLRSVTVLNPHVELVSTASPASPGAASGSSLPPARSRSKEPPSAFEVKPAPREQESHGMRSLKWEVEDPNADDLAFDLYYRGDEETSWKLMAEELGEPFHSFDATSLPDGVYYARVVVTDSPSNPDDRTLQSEIESEPFVIDNTPPRVEVTEARLQSGKIVVQARASDRTSVLQWGEYSLDGGSWRPVNPQDLVYDEREETLSFVVDEVEPEEHTVAVRVEDAARNSGSGKAVVRP